MYTRKKVRSMTVVLWPATTRVFSVHLLPEHGLWLGPPPRTRGESSSVCPIVGEEVVLASISLVKPSRSAKLCSVCAAAAASWGAGARRSWEGKAWQGWERSGMHKVEGWGLGGKGGKGIGGGRLGDWA